MTVNTIRRNYNRQTDRMTDRLTHCISVPPYVRHAKSARCRVAINKTRIGPYITRENAMSAAIAFMTESGIGNIFIFYLFHLCVETRNVIGQYGVT